MMIRDDEHWLQLTDEFHAAAIDPGRWYGALSAFAGATGSRHGQLVCMGEDASMTFNLLTDVDPSLPDAFLAAGGADPSINPRRRAGISRPPLTVIAESDFITPDACQRDTHYREFAIPWDVPYICLTTLERRAGLLVGLAVVRSKQQGHIDDVGRRVFSTIAPHVRAAVRTNLMLADQWSALACDAFEMLSIPALVCDRAGRVRRLTPSAEALVAGNRGLELRFGKLAALRTSESAALTTAIEAAGKDRRVGAAAHHVVVVHGPEGMPPLVLDIIPLPSRALLATFDARALVLVRGIGANGDKRRSALLQSVYGMTAAETEIALQLAQGKLPEAIAKQRNVSIGTVRAQIKALLPKAGVSRQVELVARLNQL
jgi:DNA-binding CsgD family transcriptional regulator